MNENGIGTIEHNEMFMRPSSMAYVQGGRPLDPRLEGKDDLNCCEVELPQRLCTCMLYIWQWSFLGPNEYCILMFSSFDK